MEKELLTPAGVVALLKKDGVELSPEEAALVLAFMQRLAELALKMEGNDARLGEII